MQKQSTINNIILLRNGEGYFFLSMSKKKKRGTVHATKLEIRTQKANFIRSGIFTEQELEYMRAKNKKS